MSLQETDHRRRHVRRQLAETSRRGWRRGENGGAHRQWSSRQLHRLGAATSHAWAGVVAAAGALGWVIYGAVAGFPSYWQGILESITSIVTVVMLFAIQ